MSESSPRRSRRLWSTEEKRAFLAHHAQSALPVADFCRQQNIPLSSFHQWKRALAAAAADPTASSATATAFVEIKLPAPLAPSPTPVEVLLPRGTRLATSSACDPAWPARLLHALENESC